MKKSIVIGVILSASIASSAATAAMEVSTEVKRDSVVFGSIATGAMAGGPVGALVGTLVGSWLGEKVVAAQQLDNTTAELAEARASADELAKKLAASDVAIDVSRPTITSDDQPIAWPPLQFELLFKTGVSELTLAAQLKMSLLASLLIEQPPLLVSLDGYADPRGTESFNQRLSEQRVAAVQNFLLSKGVEAERFSVNSHGASQSSAVVGDYDGYALERVVKVQVSSSRTANSDRQNQQDSLARAVIP